MPRHRQRDQLTELVARIVDSRQEHDSISPSSVASAALRQLDPAQTIERSAPLIWMGCHLELRQIARQLLAKTVEDDERHDDLFPQLQWRYPAAPSSDGEEGTYVRRTAMTAADIAYNVARLRTEAATKQRHADALEAWGRSRGLREAA